MVLTVNIYVIRLEGDDPKKSTALKLVRFGLAEKVSGPRDLPRGVVVLNPAASKVLTPLDRDFILKYGLVVIDASWNKGVDPIIKVCRRIRGHHRVLPMLFAGNPINYAVPTKLSSAEAIAAALYIVGLKTEALRVLSKFKWGATFLNLNKELLEKYSKTSTVEEVLTIQGKVLEKLKPK